MEKETIKKIAAGLEIYIYILVAFYLIQKYIAKYWIEDLKSDRQSPLAIAVNNSKEGFAGVIGQKVKELFKNFLGFLTPVFSAFGSIFTIFQDQINGIRNILKPTRDFFKQATNVFYDKIQGFTIGILYSLHKIRNTMRRSLSGFNLIFHTLEHNKNTIESLIESPPIALAEKLLPPLDWVFDKGRRLNRAFCFDGNTPIKLKSKLLVPISMINVGDILADGTRIIATHKFLNKERLYRYNRVLVTGSHLVYRDDNSLVRVDSLKDAELTEYTPDYVYSLSTTSKHIVIYDTKFADYSESSDRFKNYEINNAILTYLNGRPDVEPFPSQHLDHGFSCSSFVVMDNKSIKPIEDIHIGEKLFKGSLVIGKVELLSDVFQFYSYHDICVSNNCKVLEDGLWKNVEMSKKYEPSSKPRKAYNLVTSDNKIYILDKNNMAIEFRDYLEHNSDTLYSKIESIVMEK